MEMMELLSAPIQSCPKRRFCCTLCSLTYSASLQMAALERRFVTRRFLTCKLRRRMRSNLTLFSCLGSVTQSRPPRALILPAGAQRWPGRPKSATAQAHLPRKSLQAYFISLFISGPGSLFPKSCSLTAPFPS